MREVKLRRDDNMNKINNNDGFTLLEVVLSSVILAMLFLFTFRMFNATFGLNILSNDKDKSSDLASSFIEELSNYSYDSINENFKFSTGLIGAEDENKPEYLISENIDTKQKTIDISNLHVGSNVYTAHLEITANENSVINDTQFPDIHNINADDTCIIWSDASNDKMATKFNVADDGTYELSDGFKNYDEDLIHEIYEKICKDITDYNNLHAEEDNFIPLDYPTTEESLYEDATKTTDINITNYGEKVKVGATVKISRNFIVDTNKEYTAEKTLLSTKEFDNLKNIVFSHKKSQITREYLTTPIDTINITNNRADATVENDAKFNLFIYEQDKNPNSMDYTDSMLEININQDLPTNVITLICNNRSVLDRTIGSSYLVDRIYDNSVKFDKRIRMYNVYIEINNNTKNRIYQKMTYNVLK